MDLAIWLINLRMKDVEAIVWVLLWKDSDQFRKLRMMVKVLGKLIDKLLIPEVQKLLGHQ
jgi:hypothetical protein